MSSILRKKSKLSREMAFTYERKRDIIMGYKANVSDGLSEMLSGGAKAEYPRQTALAGAEGAELVARFGQVRIVNR